MSLLQVPHVSLKSGPLHVDGTSFDHDGDGTADTEIIAIGFTESQHYRYGAGIGNWGENRLGEFALMDVLPEGFELDPDAEQAATGCNDGRCDGVQVGSCPVAISGPPLKHNVVDARYVVLEPSNVPVGSSCGWDTFVKTSPVKRKGNETIFAPTSCITAQGTGTRSITRPIQLNDGVLLFDKVTGSVLGTVTHSGGPVTNPIYLKVLGCSGPRVVPGGHGVVLP